MHERICVRLVQQVFHEKIILWNKSRFLKGRNAVNHISKNFIFLQVDHFSCKGEIQLADLK